MQFFLVLYLENVFQIIQAKHILKNRKKTQFKYDLRGFNSPILIFEGLEKVKLYAIQ